MYKISQVSKILGVDKKTLMRWDNEGKYPAIREKHSNIRLYDEIDIQNHALWFDIRRKHKAHLRLLPALNEERNKFINTKPLQPGESPKSFPLKEMKKAYDAIHKWEDEENEILKEYTRVPDGFKHKIDPFY